MKNFKVLLAAVLIIFSVASCKEKAPENTQTTEVKEEVKETPDTTQKVEGEKPDTGIIVKETTK